MYIIENIATELGERIVKELRKEAWRKIDEYSFFAFDKGIDFDSYTLKRDSEFLYFEWTNWFEWQVEGSLSVLTQLAQRYQLTPPVELAEKK